MGQMSENRHSGMKWLSQLFILKCVTTDIHDSYRILLLKAASHRACDFLANAIFMRPKKL